MSLDEHFKGKNIHNLLISCWEGGAFVFITRYIFNSCPFKAEFQNIRYPKESKAYIKLLTQFRHTLAIFHAIICLSWKHFLVWCFKSSPCREIRPTKLSHCATSLYTNIATIFTKEPQIIGNNNEPLYNINFVFCANCNIVRKPNFLLIYYKLLSYLHAARILEW